MEEIYWRNTDGRRWIKRGSIREHFDEVFLSAVSEWKRWQTFGLPHGSGPMHERAELVQAIQIVEDERNYYQHRESEKRRKKDDSRGTTGSHTR